MTPNLFNLSSNIHFHIFHHITHANLLKNIRKPILRISKQFFKIFLPRRGLASCNTGGRGDVLIPEMETLERGTNK
jgi:hypothetical protein